MKIAIYTTRTNRMRIEEVLKKFGIKTPLENYNPDGQKPKNSLEAAYVVEVSDGSLRWLTGLSSLITKYKVLESDSHGIGKRR